MRGETYLAITWISPDRLGIQQHSCSLYTSIQTNTNKSLLLIYDILSGLPAEDCYNVTVSEEEFGILQMALMRGMSSSSPYFKEECEKLLYKVLGRMSERK